MKEKMNGLQSLINEVDKYCYENEIDFIFAAQAKDKSFSIKLISKGAKTILNVVDEVIGMLKTN